MLGKVYRWTDPQRAFFDSPYRVTVWRDGNAMGKSLAQAELTRRAIAGALYWQRPSRKGRTVMLVGNTLAQLAQTLEYLFELCDRRWFKERVRFEDGTVKGQRTRTFEIVDGPGKGGKLILAVFDAKNLAGPRAEVIISDEPLPQGVYNELWPRLLGRGGRLYMGFTVTLGTAHRLDWLWALVDDDTKPQIGELNFGLSLANVTPRGGLLEMPWISAAELAQFEQGVSALEADMRMGRTRHPRLDTAYFSCWDRERHVDAWTPPPNGTKCGIGVDHGSKPGAQRAMFVAVQGLGLEARVWVIDEYMGGGRTESEQDAEGILALLERQYPGHTPLQQLEAIDKWIGDRSHGGYSGGHGFKSNERLREAIARKVGLFTGRRGWTADLPEPLRKFWTPYKTDNSHWEGMAVLFDLLASGRLLVHPRCVKLIEDLEQWQGVRTDPHKDGLDALRYIVVPMVEGVRH